MLHLGIAHLWHFVLLAMCCYCTHHVTGQCVMEDKVGYQGADTGSTGVTDPIASFDECKAYCLADDDCMAAEFRFSFACLVWNQDPQETVEAGSTIALKVCTPDPTGSNSSSLMPSEGTTSSSMADQITSTRTATATATVVVCPHGVEEITGPKDYLEIDGGPSFGDDAFTEDGWESTTQGGDTLTITFTGEDEKTLRQLSFVVKNGEMTQLSVLVETTPGNFAPPDFIDLQTNEQSYTRSFNTPVASISITTSETISRLAITICNETPDGGATSSTPVLQTSSIIMSSSATSTSSNSISPTQTTEPDGGDTSSASVRQTTVTEVIRTTMTSDMLSTSDIFTSSDLISSTVTVSVSGLISNATSSTQPVPTTSMQVIQPTSTLVNGSSETPTEDTTSPSASTGLVSNTLVTTSSTQPVPTTSMQVIQPISTPVIGASDTPTENSTSSSTSSGLVSNTLVTTSPTQPVPTTSTQVIQPTSTLVIPSSHTPTENATSPSASSEPSTQVIALTAAGAFIICAFIAVFLAVVIYIARRPRRRSSSKPKAKGFSNSSSTPSGKGEAKGNHTKAKVSEYKSHFIPPKEPQYLFHIPRPRFNV